MNEISVSVDDKKRKAANNKESHKQIEVFFNDQYIKREKNWSDVWNSELMVVPLID